MSLFPNRPQRRWPRLLWALAALPLLLLGGGWGLLRYSLPPANARYALSGFAQSASIDYDAHGLPKITAQNRPDAYRALGFAVARDRLFQMDLLRRNAAGRLAEIFGAAVLAEDDWHRRMGFAPLAAKIWARLPQAQQALLQAYAEGVNQAMAALPAPFEFRVLGYQPAAWTPQDSLLVVLGMFDTLTGWAKDSERMATVMEAALDPKVVAFFTPDTDRYTDQLGLGPAQRPTQPLPAAELQTLLAQAGAAKGLARAGRVLAGSNGWLLAPGKTRGGRALLANDMHLALQVPNIWHRAELRIGADWVAGITLPGVPLFISGSNGRIAWGFTNTAGDFIDLVRIDRDPGDPDRYASPQGYKPFTRRSETIHVRGGEDVRIEVRETDWGPLLAEPLLGQPVAVRWTLLDPASTDLALAQLADTDDVLQALALLAKAGGPPLNALVADRQGNIGWSYTGKIPLRVGLDGLFSRAWADGKHGWNGYLAAKDMPQALNPPQGFLVNANQRMTGQAFPHPIGQDFNNGYRAFRIAEQLAGLHGATEKDLLKLQLDAKAEFYRFYQGVALAALAAAPNPAEWAELKHQLEAWDGYAEPDSPGLALLVEFRQRLADAALSPFMARCRVLEPGFKYQWGNLDEPLQRLLEAQPPALLPDAKFPDWPAFLRAQLRAAAQAAAARCDDANWGCANRVKIGHVFAQALPALAPLLDMEAQALPGCVDCVRMAAPGEGASERLVVAPGHEANAILHLPGGQSGHPLSPFYRDQQRYWLDGRALGLLAGPAEASLTIIPAQAPLPQ